MFNQFYYYASKRFTFLFSKPKGAKGISTSSNQWSKLLLDIYIKSNYTLPLELINNTRILEWFEVKDREAEIQDQEYKAQKEALKNTKK